MKDATRKYLAETLRLLAVGQLAAFAYAGANSDPIDWAAIGMSCLMAGALIAAGAAIMESTSEKSS